MQIDKIHIENFRCFKNYDVSFGKRTTVLIGKNGTGKTNLLTALIYSLSFPFAKNKMKDVQTISTSNPDLKIAAIDNKGRFDARYDDEKDDYIYPIRLINEAHFDDDLLSWSMVKEKKDGGILSSLYKQAFEKFQIYYNENSSSKPLPVLAFFSDSFPHIDANISGYAKSALSSENGFSRNFGYYKWDEKNNCIGIWEERYIKIYSSLNNFKRPEFGIIEELNELYLIIENDPFNAEIIKLEHRAENLRKKLEQINSERKNDPEYTELTFIDSKLKKFTGPLLDKFNFINEEFQIDTLKVIGTAKTEQRIQIIFKTGKKMFFNDLPMGYKRLFSIVFDVAYRSYILNKNTEPTGIVIIDEIELHLHPSLQQEVLQRFMNTFPEVQFIVSTHSALVISNLKADETENIIIKLENDNFNFSNKKVENLYGIDYTTSLIEVMDANYRPSTIDKLINAYIVLFGKNKLAEAEAVMVKLKDYLGGSIPVLLQQEINNMLKAFDTL